MSDISVNFDALDSGATGIRNNYARLTATLEQLESDLQPMIATWSGSAQQSYLACKKQWDDAAASLAQILSSIGQAVAGAHDSYTATESAAQANWS